MEIKKSKVYTRSGDKGMTSLVGGKRVLKSDIRLESYGSIDELNSFLGLLIHEMKDFEEKNLFIEVQKHLFTIGAILATETKEIADRYGCFVVSTDIQLLEKEIDRIDSELPKMTRFVLPGGSKVASLAHICRSICRRAERHIITLSNESEVSHELLIYINRLSDLFFVFARKAAIRENSTEIFWHAPTN